MRLRLLYKAVASLTLNKCRLFADTVYYLGHVIRSGRLNLEEQTTDAAAKHQHHTKHTELRFLLDFCNVFRQFVSSSARLAAPFSKKLRKGGA